MKALSRIVSALGGIALAGAALMAGTPAHAEVPIGADRTPSVGVSFCGHQVQNTIGGEKVMYRHCGAGEVRVRAIINNWPDGSCRTVRESDGEVELMRWIWPGSFDRIDRC